MPPAFYSSTDANLATGSTNLISIVTPVPATYGLSSAIVTSYTSLSTSYVSLLGISTEPATRTSVAVAAKNAARHLLRQASVNIARTITATPTVSNAQLLALNLNERIVPQPRPVPAAPPALEVKSVEGRLVHIVVHDSTSSRRGKPFGAVSAYVYSYVGAEAPTDPRLYHFEGATTRPKATLQFPNTVASGATVWLSASWVSARGQTGPASPPVSFTLQGGAVTPAAA